MTISNRVFFYFLFLFYIFWLRRKFLGGVSLEGVERLRENIQNSKFCDLGFRGYAWETVLRVTPILPMDLFCPIGVIFNWQRPIRSTNVFFDSRLADWGCVPTFTRQRPDWVDIDNVLRVSINNDENIALSIFGSIETLNITSF